MNKIFGIGLPRTGTASLCESLKILGYKSKHYPKYLCKVDEFDALVDSPIPLHYKYLNEKYSNSKFILTIRDEESWINSVKKASKRFMWHNLKPNGRCGPEVYEMHIKLFNCTGFDEHKMRNGYRKFNEEVINYFKDNNNLLIYNLCDGEGWFKLCKFLNKDIPNIKFPDRNKSV